jgi:endonuclease/exonuclease/phosphatase family metal-dependent hydrolase
MRAVAARLALAAALMMACAHVGAAQTTVTISQPESETWAVTLRGGTYANTNLSGTLETRSSTDPEYLRRALLKFDTENLIPKGAAVTSAVMTVTVAQGSADASRRIGVYQVTTSWDEDAANWNRRRSGIAWGTAGGDLGTKITEATVSNVAGSQALFDITALVKQATAGALGSSRYTRIALVDLEDATKESWRQYYPPSTSIASLRPTLKVTYGSATSGPVTSTSTSTSTPTPTSSSGKLLRVLHWNIQKNGWGTDGKYDPDRVATWVAKMNPDVISFNEIEKDNSYSLGADGVALYTSLLEQKTGITWYTWEAQDYGVWNDKGLRSVVFSKFPISATYRTVYTAGTLRAIGGATIAVNGRTINFMTTHFDPYSASYRQIQATQMVSYAATFAEDRIVCGDFNDQSWNLTNITAVYHDAWADAKKAGVAYSAPDNPDGNTRNSRIDYIFYSRTEAHLTLNKVTVVDTRDANGVMPSDHRPVLAEFTVN